MTLEEARKLIPPGWVECSCRDYHEVGAAELPGEPAMRLMVVLCGKPLYAIPAPKPEPRRVPCGEMVVGFNRNCDTLVGFTDVAGAIRESCHDDVANTKWRLDFDTREWVEEVE